MRCQSGRLWRKSRTWSGLQHEDATERQRLIASLTIYLNK